MKVLYVHAFGAKGDGVLGKDCFANVAELVKSAGNGPIGEFLIGPHEVPIAYVRELSDLKDDSVIDDGDVVLINAHGNGVDTDIGNNGTWVTVANAVEYVADRIAADKTTEVYWKVCFSSRSKAHVAEQFKKKRKKCRVYGLAEAAQGALCKTTRRGITAITFAGDLSEV